MPKLPGGDSVRRLARADIAATENEAPLLHIRDRFVICEQFGTLRLLAP